MGIDVSHRVAPIVGRVPKDGVAINVAEAKGPVSKTDQKRAKRLQEVGDETEDDEFSSEDDGRMDIKIDSDDDADEIPAVDEELPLQDGVGTIGAADRGGYMGEIREGNTSRGREGDASKEREESSEEEDDIVDDREMEEGDESKEDGTDSGNESEQKHNSRQWKKPVRTRRGKENTGPSSQPFN